MPQRAGDAPLERYGRPAYLGEGTQTSDVGRDAQASTPTPLARAGRIPLAALAACIVAFAGLALDAPGALQGLDGTVFETIRSSTSSGLVDVLLIKGSWLADRRVAALIAVLAVAVLIPTRGWRPALLVAGSGLVAYFAAGYLKEVFELPRPPVSEHRVAVGGYGFPSAHAALSVALYGSLTALAIRPAALLLKRVARPGRREFIICAGAVVSAGLLVVLWVGVSRVYSGVHYPADVVGGYLVGAFALLLVGMLLYPEHRWHSLRSALVAVAFRWRNPARNPGLPHTGR